MEYLIFALALLAVLHFVYEGIIAPSYRLEHRYKLFALRDELRMLKIREKDSLQAKHFDYLQDAINGLLRNIDRIDLAMIVALRVQVATDKDFAVRVAARAKMLDDCPLPEGREIRSRAGKIIEHILTANNGAWIFYVIPVALAWACYWWTIQSIKAITALSEPDIDRLSIPTALRRRHA